VKDHWSLRKLLLLCALNLRKTSSNSLLMLENIKSVVISQAKKQMVQTEDR